MENIYDNLWVGDMWDVQNHDLQQLDTVISVCTVDIKTPESVYHRKFKLLDGDVDVETDVGSYDYSLFEEAVDLVIDKLQDGETVFVHCNAGMSRSVMVCAAAIAVLEQETLDESKERIRKKRSINPHNDITLFAEKYVSS